MRLAASWMLPTTAKMRAIQIATGAIAIGALFSGVLWQWWALAGFGYFMFGCVGHTVGYHRYFVHNSFRAPRWAQAMFALCGTLGCAGSRMAWAIMHRRRHLHSDKEDDPYAAHRHRYPDWSALMLGEYRGSLVPTYVQNTSLQVRMIVIVFIFSALFSNLAIADCNKLCGGSEISRLTPEEISSLLKSGEKVNARSKIGWTPLMYAVFKESNPEVIKTLLDAGAHVNDRSPETENTVLHFAIESEHNDAQIIRILLEAGADINAASNYPNTSPLSLAVVLKRDSQIIRMLIAAGADVNFSDSAYGVTPLMGISVFFPEPELAQFLISRGANVNAQDKNGVSSLMYAAGYNKTPLAAEMIEILLNANANVKLKDFNQLTVLDYIKHNDTLRNTPIHETIKRLISK